MGLIDLFKRKKPLPEAEVSVQLEAVSNEPEKSAADIVTIAQQNSGPGFAASYNGSKTLAGAGPIIRQYADIYGLSLRGQEAYLTQQVAKTAIDTKVKWNIGRGLMLNSEPLVDYLAKVGIKIADVEKFNNEVEDMWRLYMNSEQSDYAKRATLPKISKRIEKNRRNSGDILVVLRVEENGNVTTQLIDGIHVVTPPTFPVNANLFEMVDNKIGFDRINPDNGNIVRMGVEISHTGEHLAYWVRFGVALNYIRIPAKEPVFGLETAFLVYGNEFRLDDIRGIPDIHASVEVLKQLDEYIVASVGKATEVAKVALVITHEKGTEVTNPMAGDMAVAFGYDPNLPQLATGQEIANKVSVTEGKNAYNMSAGSDMHAIMSEGEVNYPEFKTAVSNSTFASMDIPPEIANQLFSASYSASRMATQMYKYTINIERNDIGHQYFSKLYKLQFTMWVLGGKVKAQGYIEALKKKDMYIVNAYTNCQWIGDTMAEVDDLKAAQAKRLMLGTGYDHVPLTTPEMATRDLGQGSFTANIQQAAEELKETEKLGIKPIVHPGQAPTDGSKQGNPPKKAEYQSLTAKYITDGEL